MNKKTIKRDQSIDMIKGIGITMMVLGHTSFKFSNFIYLFHMAIFFIVSGYLYKDEYSDNFFIHINVYTNNLMLLKNVEGIHINLHDFMSKKK